MIDLNECANDEIIPPELPPKRIIQEDVQLPKVKPIKVNLITCIFLFCLGLWI